MVDESKEEYIIPVRRKNFHAKKTIATKIKDFNILVPFANHPFSLYDGQRFLDMVESVRNNGVLVPIIVRPHPIEHDKYEILSGHNRVAAAKEAEVNEIPALLKKGLTDEEAIFIVTETNLIQRSFTDMKPSERAIALATRYEAMKKNSRLPF